jgi:hypothetical protein
MWWLEVRGEGKGEEENGDQDKGGRGETRVGTVNKSSSKLPRGKKWTRPPD